MERKVTPDGRAGSPRTTTHEALALCDRSKEGDRVPFGAATRNPLTKWTYLESASVRLPAPPVFGFFA